MGNYVFTLHKKSQEEIEKFESEEALLHGYHNNEKHSEADENFVINPNGERKELCDLTERNVINIVRNAVISNIQEKDVVSLKNAVELLNILNYKPTLEGMVKIYDIYQNKKIASTIDDVFGVSLLLKEAKAIAKYTGEDLRDVLVNMQKQEKEEAPDAKGLDDIVKPSKFISSLERENQ